MKNKCPRCNEKISKKYEFCPFCGHNLNKNSQRDYGFLGRSDSDFFPENMFSNSMIDKIFSSAMKMLEKQMKQLNQEAQQPRQNYPNDLNVQFFVNGKRVNLTPVKIKPKQNQVQKIKRQLTKEQEERLFSLPKKEPKSKVRRLSGKVVYELEVPGVTNLDDVIINQLENSIEIKALSEKKVYAKTININLPILRYGLMKDNLILELKA